MSRRDFSLRSLPFVRARAQARMAYNPLPLPVAALPWRVVAVLEWHAALVRMVPVQGAFLTDLTSRPITRAECSGPHLEFVLATACERCVRVGWCTRPARVTPTLEQPTQKSHWLPFPYEIERFSVRWPDEYRGTRPRLMGWDGDGFGAGGTERIASAGCMGRSSRRPREARCGQPQT